MTYAQNMQEPEFIAARGRTTALTVLVIAQVVVLAVAAIAMMVGASSLDGDPTTAMPAFTVAGGLWIFFGLLYVAACVVFFTWVYRATANLPALGSMSARFTPASSVWWYFVPFANLVKGHQIMANIWRESQPPVVDANGFYAPRKTTLVNWWWALVVIGIFVGRSDRNVSGFTPDQLHLLANVQLVQSALEIATGLLFLFMVRGAQKRQEEQWQDIVRRRDVPQPTADALR